MNAAIASFFLLGLSLSGISPLKLSFSSMPIKEAVTTDASSITMSDISNFLSKKQEHYPQSDAFIETYQQTSGGYIDYAKQTGHLVDKSQHEPNQKWHFFDSWLYRSIDDGSLQWNELAKSRVYSKLLCPELLLWIYEACGADSDLVAQAKQIAEEGKQNGTSVSSMASSMRKVVSWDELATNILAGLSEDDPHHVNPAVGEGFAVSGLSYAGYGVGETVDFTVSITTAGKEIETVSVDGETLTDLGGGHYQFAMPDHIVSLSVTLSGEEVVPEGDTVTALSWTGRSAINAFVGDSLEDSCDTSKWTFKPTWSSGKEDHPAFGIGENDVHIGLYSTSSPAAEGTPLEGSYCFKEEDNGKYLVAFYQGKRSSSNSAISVKKWRSVKENFASAEAVFDFSPIAKNSTSEMSSDTLSSYYLSSSSLANGKVASSKIYPYYGDSGALKLGTASYPGSLEIAFDEGVSISSVTVRAKGYSSSEKSLIVMGKSQALTTEFADYAFSVASGDFEANNLFTLATPTSSKRAYVSSISITASGIQEIGKTADCLALESFIDDYLHMKDYQENLGNCLSYYPLAKETFSELSSRQKSLFASNASYAEEFARISAWASANGEVFSDELHRFVSSSFLAPSFEGGKTLAWILLPSGILGLVLVISLRKRKRLF